MVEKIQPESLNEKVRNSNIIQIFTEQVEKLIENVSKT
jgi:hypothetical protein